LSNGDFNKLKKTTLKGHVFLEDKSLAYLEGFYGIVKEEGLLGVEKKIDELKIVINKSKVELIDRFKEDITTVLEREIVRRFYYRRGVYEYLLLKNKDVIKAQKLLNTPEAYLGLLK
jgi:carboxyl-terminal processing protease